MYPENQAAGIAAQRDGEIMCQAAEDLGFDNDICGYARISLAYAAGKRAARKFDPETLQFIIDPNSGKPLKDADGKGVRFSADFPMFVQALHFSMEDLMGARHFNGERRRAYIVEPRSEICLNIDLRQLGLGGASCGPAPMDKYKVPVQHETFTIKISACE